MKKFFIILITLLLLTGCGEVTTTDTKPIQTSTPNYTTKPTEKPTETPTIKPTIKPTEKPTEEKTEIVYITNSGKKYHSDGCIYLKKSKIAIDKKKAVLQGYEPCSKCKP